MFCSKCGNNVEESAAFCNACGEKMINVGIQNNPTPRNDYNQDQNQGQNQGQNQDDVLKALIGKNQDYYLAQFKKINSGGKSFNVVAFFFAPITLLYRKMYGLFCKLLLPVYILLILSTLISTITAASFDLGAIIFGSVLSFAGGLYGLVAAIVSGQTFNKKYMQYLVKTIEENKITPNNLRDPAIQAIISKKHKPSAAVPVMFLVIYMVLYIILQAIGTIGASSATMYEPEAKATYSESTTKSPSTQTAAPIPTPSEKIIKPDEFNNFYSNPNSYKGYGIDFYGTVFNILTTENQNEIQAQVYANNNSDQGIVIVANNPPFTLEDKDVIHIKGTVRGTAELNNVYGAKVTVVVVDVTEMEASDHASAYAPAIFTRTFNGSTSLALGVTCTIEKVEFAENETRIYLGIDNASGADISLFVASSKIVQNKKQYEILYTEYNSPYPMLEGSIPNKVEEFGVLTFPGIDLSLSEFDLILEGWLVGNTITIRYDNQSSNGGSSSSENTPVESSAPIQNPSEQASATTSSTTNREFTQKEIDDMSLFLSNFSEVNMWYDIDPYGYLSAYQLDAANVYFGIYHNYYNNPNVIEFNGERAYIDKKHVDASCERYFGYPIYDHDIYYEEDAAQFYGDIVYDGNGYSFTWGDGGGSVYAKVSYVELLEDGTYLARGYLYVEWSGEATGEHFTANFKDHTYNGKDTYALISFSEMGVQ